MPKPKDNAKGSPHDFAVAYLNVLLDDADPEELTAALGRLARVSGGPKLVEKVELSAPAFYRTLCRRGNPELKSVAALLKAMGIRLALQPLSDANRYAGRQYAGHRYAGQPIQHLRTRREMKLEEEAAWL
jgi:probable addiction module antidote protein